MADANFQVKKGLTVPKGSESEPSIIFTAADSDTGIFSPGNNEVAIASSGIQRVNFGTSEVVFNDNGENVDLRIEGNSEANLVFVDASTDRVGLGTSSPSSLLHLNESSTSGYTTFRLANSGASGRTYEIGVGGNTTASGYANNLYIYDATAAQPRVVLDSSGNVGIDPNGAGGYDVLFNPGTSSSPLVRDSSGRLLVGTPSNLSSSSLLQVYKESGNVSALVRSGSLANNESCLVTAGTSTRFGQIGVYRHSGITDACSYVTWTCEDGANNFLWVDNSDILRISTNADHIGTTNGTVVGTQTSDKRLKNILGPIQYGLDTIKQIEPVRFSLKSEPETEKLGFIAQQVQPLVPQLVFDTGEHIEGEPEDAPTKLGMEYVALIPVLVNAVKELSAEVDALKAQLQTL